MEQDLVSASPGSAFDAAASTDRLILYHCFGSKDDLFQMVLDQSHLDIRDAQRQLRLDSPALRQAREKV